MEAVYWHDCWSDGTRTSPGMAEMSGSVESDDLEADDNMVTAAMASASGLPEYTTTTTGNILYSLETSAATVQLSGGVRTNFGQKTQRQEKLNKSTVALEGVDNALKKVKLSDSAKDDSHREMHEKTVNSKDGNACVTNGIDGELSNHSEHGRSVTSVEQSDSNRQIQENYVKDEHSENGVIVKLDLPQEMDHCDQTDDCDIDYASEFQGTPVRRRRSHAFSEHGSSLPSSMSSVERSSPSDKLGTSLTDMKCRYKEERFNPFDKDLAIEEDYFVDDPVIDSMRRPTSVSNASSNWTAELSHPVSENSDDITYADLGLAEDHFCQPEGHFGLSGTEEMELAIETCKEMILEATPHSDKQKNLVRKLVQLRLKLQELKEGPEPVPEDVKMVVGHKFYFRTSKSSKHYCEKCNGVIWGLVQTWYKCAECGYCSHEKCLNLITRTCASVKVKEDPSFCLSICPDRGLSTQGYRCAECRAQVSFKAGFSEPRLCDYSGSYYCELCHWNDAMIIPARVLHNWDFGLYKVCRASKQFLKLMSNKAVIRVLDINPMLFNYVEELNEIKKMREELLIMKKYILLCTYAMKSKVLLHLKTRQHFVESSDIYSMKDLLAVQADTLLPELAQVHTSWAQHIKTDCQLCQARGCLCELCDNQEVLFPFDNIATVCSQCSYVMHRHCFAQKGNKCPRCERRNHRLHD